jgi:NTP pyrophosphatase (non-canonical NTP hydrolase)
MPSSEPDIRTFEGLVERAAEFRDARDWRQFHSLKNLAAAIAIEAAELQELLLWSADEDAHEVLKERREQIEQELADILIYCAHFASTAGIEIPAALGRKLALNEAKYPIEKARGSAAKYDAL